ncbi:MAG: hypothetical protein ABI620_01405 [Chloroflexota bacterium]
MTTTSLPASRRLSRLSRRTRRLAVVGLFAGYPLVQFGYGALVLNGVLSSAVWAPVAIVLFGISIVGALVVYAFGQGRMGYPKRQLDERQRAMHDRALVISYGVVTTIVGLFLGALAGWAMNEPVVITMAGLVPVLIGAGLYLPSLPFAALAWIEPDVPADDGA